MSCQNYTYRGYGNDNSAGGRLVIIELDGDLVAVLPHLPKHAEAFSWGYGGSSPSDLARCLLIHALGAAAQCTTCNTTGRIPASARWTHQQGASAAAPHVDDETTLCCPDCDQGYRITQQTYLDFKNDVIARLPLRGWRMTRREVLHWLDHHQ